MDIAVIGQGYIGLPTTLVLADSGHKVIGVDTDTDKIDKLSHGQLTFKEEGLDELFARVLKKDLTFQQEYPEAEMYIVAVPTPYKDGNKKVDPQFVVDATERITEVAPHGAIVVIESTISPGVTDEYVRSAIESKGRTLGDDLHIVHAPERIIPGNMLYELYNNSRTIGADDLETANRVKEAYASFCNGEIIITDIRTAELSKVVENTYRDINIAFANELSRICNTAGVDVFEVIAVANHHPRVNILTPGPGTGGHCIPVDPWFLVGDYPEQAKLIRQARDVNVGQPMYVWNLAQEDFASVGFDETAKVGLYGITYKENVDDIRESPTLQLVNQMTAEQRANTIMYDPYVENDLVEGQYHDFDKFLEDSDVVIIMVGHNQIKEDVAKFNNATVFDAKNTVELKEHAKNYFTL